MIQKPKGTADILPGQIETWHYIEETTHILMNDYRFKEIRTPIFESFDLFSRSVGDTTDIVTKEMYDFMDKGDRHLALRPEGTAPIVRAFIENKLYGPEHDNPYKVYYISPMFRYERPQSGRQRQFHQVGVEVFGSYNPATDVETIALAYDLLTELGVRGLSLEINSLGNPESRQAFHTALVDYLKPFEDQLSPDSKTRLHRNPLRVLDSKDPSDQEIVKNAPSILDFLSEDSKAHFEAVQEMLTALDIPFKVNTTMVRGLDYYQDTIFEIISTDDVFESPITVCGGGRYDDLVEELGGPETPGFGFGLGLERLIMVMESQKVEIPEEDPLDVFVVGIGEETNLQSLKIVQLARQAGYSANRDFLNRKPKAQFKQADRQHARVTITIGQNEIEEGVVQFKNMDSGKQETVAYQDLVDNFDQVYRMQTIDNTAIDEFFKNN